MYGGVTDIADQPMSYTYGDNIYFDVRPLLALQMPTVRQFPAESESSAFLGHWHDEIGVDLGYMRRIPQKTLSALKKVHWPMAICVKLRGMQ